MSARPLFDIPEGWARVVEGEIIPTEHAAVKKDCGVWAPKRNTILSGYEVLPNHTNWYFRRIEPPSTAPAVDLFCLQCGPEGLCRRCQDAAGDEVSALKAENAALVARVSALEGALDKIESQAVCVAFPATNEELCEWLSRISDIAREALGSAKRGPSATEGE